MDQIGFLEGLIQDVRYGWRNLRKNPGFTVVAVLTLALGIGATTSIFTMINAVMMTRLPIGHPDQLVLFHWISRTKGPYVWNSSSSYGGCDAIDAGSGNSNVLIFFSGLPEFPRACAELSGNCRVWRRSRRTSGYERPCDTRERAICERRLFLGAGSSPCVWPDFQ